MAARLGLTFERIALLCVAVGAVLAAAVIDAGTERYDGIVPALVPGIGAMTALAYWYVVRGIALLAAVAEAALLGGVLRVFAVDTEGESGFVMLWIYFVGVPLFVVVWIVDRVVANRIRHSTLTQDP